MEKRQRIFSAAVQIPLIQILFAYQLIKLLIIQKLVKCVCYDLILIIIHDVVQAGISVCILCITIQIYPVSYTHLLS